MERGSPKSEKSRGVNAQPRPFAEMRRRILCGWLVVATAFMLKIIHGFYNMSSIGFRDFGFREDVVSSDN